MLFAHFSDCHVGGWKEDKLSSLNMQCFKEAVKLCLVKNVDFVLIPGDLFNSALPQIDFIKEVTSELKTLKDRNIPVYMVAGSHDYSPSGKTMLDVLEKAGLIENVMKINDEKLGFIVDKKTGVKIAGLHGKRGGLEIKDYETLDFSSIENEEGYKVFLFHTAIEEFKPKGLENMPGTTASSLPKGFNYYAGGHVHYIFQKEFEKGHLTFPGALFPNNFKELEEWKYGGVYLVSETNLEYVPIKMKEVVNVRVDVTNLSPEEVSERIIERIKYLDVKDKLVTLRITGEINGKVSDINFQEILRNLEDAYFVLRNTAKLTSKVIHEFDMKSGSVEEIENEILKEVESEMFDLAFTKLLIETLDKEKDEGEKVADFEKRILSEAIKVLKIEDI